MGAEHTFFENVKQLSLIDPVAFSSSPLLSASADINVGRGNAIVLSVATFTFTGVNSLALNLQESDDNSTFTDVVNGANLGQEIGTVWGSMTADELLTDLTDPSTTLNGATLTLDDTGNDETVYVAEYLGNKRFFRLQIVEAGTVTALLSVMSGQNGLIIAPNIVDIGDNN